MFKEQDCMCSGEQDIAEGALRLDLRRENVAVGAAVKADAPESGLPLWERSRGGWCSGEQVTDEGVTEQTRYFREQDATAGFFLQEILQDRPKILRRADVCFESCFFFGVLKDLEKRKEITQKSKVVFSCFLYESHVFFFCEKNS